MQYTEKDVARLLGEVEQAFTAKLAKAEETSLAKSEDGEKEDHKEDKHEEKPEHKEAPKHEAEGEKHEGHEEGKEHEESKGHEGHENHEEKAHDYDEEDMAHMEKMYRSMSKGEIEAHHGCIMKCMGKSEAKPAEMSKNEAEGHKNGGEISACGPKDVPGAKSEASKAEGMQMEKSENTEVELLKSELAAAKAEKEELKKNHEAVKEFLTKLVAKKIAPQGKAVTSLDVVQKSESINEPKQLTKQEIHEILKTKAADPSLKKSDRDAINAYYLDAKVNVNGIKHLL